MRFSPVLPDSPISTPTTRRWRPPDFVYATPNNRRSVPQHYLPTSPTLLTYPPPSMSSLPSSSSSASSRNARPTSSCPSPNTLPSQTSVPCIPVQPLPSSHPYHNSNHNPSSENDRDLPQQLAKEGADDPDEEDAFVDAEETLQPSESQTGTQSESEIQPVPPSRPPSQPSLPLLQPSADIMEKQPLLPPPSTTRRPSRAPHSPPSALRRVLPIILALAVAISLLTCLTLFFFQKLTSIDVALRAQADAQERLHFTPDNLHPGPPLHGKAPASVPSSQHHPSFWDRLNSDVHAWIQIYRQLSEQTKISPTALLLAALPLQTVHGGPPKIVHGSPSQTVHGGRPQTVHGGRPQTVHGGRPQTVHGGRPQTVHGGPQPSLVHPLVQQLTAETNAYLRSPNGIVLQNQQAMVPRPTQPQPVQPGQPLRPQYVPPALALPGKGYMAPIITPGFPPGVKVPVIPNALAVLGAPKPPLQSAAHPLQFGPQVPIAAGVGAPAQGHPMLPPGAQAGTPPLDPNNILHQGSLNVINPMASKKTSTDPPPVPNLSDVAGKSIAVIPPPINPALTSPIVAPTMPMLQQQRGNQAASVVVKNTMSPPTLTTSTPAIESIEVWNLPHGRTLCRLFNVGRLEDGRLVLPKWIQKHETFLSNQCGISKAIFAIDTPDGRLRVDGNVLKKKLKRTYSLDFSHQDRDLFSHETPRHHMPHYISDIIKPLVAVEVLMGSGRNMLSPFSLLKTASSSMLVRSMLGNQPLNPSLLTLPESLKGATANWVRRMGLFFEHTTLGFTMIPVQRKEDATSSGERGGKVTIFQSVMSSNVNPYEPFGLFGASGKNTVFMANGISREPPWTMLSMREHPCRISITALTRNGARALLNLDFLEKTIKAKAAAQNMRADFKVVDFKDAPFEDQVRTMQDTHVLIATHGAGNANIIFMRPGAAVVEVFPFSYKAGPFDGFAKIFGLEYSTAMSAPQSNIFKSCMKEHEKSEFIRRLVFEKWDKAIEEEQRSPWVHRLEFEKEFGEPGKSEGMTTRGCVRLQQLHFNVEAVSDIAISAGKSQCFLSKTNPK